MFTFYKKNRIVFDSLATGLLFFLAIINFFFDNSDNEKKWQSFLGIVFLALAIVKLADVVVAVKSGRTVDSGGSDSHKNLDEDA